MRSDSHFFSSPAYPTNSYTIAQPPVTAVYNDESNTQQHTHVYTDEHWAALLSSESCPKGGLHDFHSLWQTSDYFLTCACLPFLCCWGCLKVMSPLCGSSPDTCGKGICSGTGAKVCNKCEGDFDILMLQLKNSRRRFNSGGNTQAMDAMPPRLSMDMVRSESNQYSMNPYPSSIGSRGYNNSYGSRRVSNASSNQPPPAHRPSISFSSQRRQSIQQQQQQQQYGYPVNSGMNMNMGRPDSMIIPERRSTIVYQNAPVFMDKGHMQ